MLGISLAFAIAISNNTTHTYVLHSVDTSGPVNHYAEKLIPADEHTVVDYAGVRYVTMYVAPQYNNVYTYIKRRVNGYAEPATGGGVEVIPPLWHSMCTPLDPDEFQTITNEFTYHGTQGQMYMFHVNYTATFRTEYYLHYVNGTLIDIVHRDGESYFYPNNGYVTFLPIGGPKT